MASFTKANTAGSIVTASYYNYDINGNVKTLWQENSALNTVSASGNGIKQIDYNFDLVSGKVNKVSYQPGKGDQFFHKYLYDAENRLTDVYTSRDELIWQQDAFYRYYLHGPLARTELGQRKVQGLDYAYTLQGWLKRMNGTSVNAQYDIGRDNYQNASEYNHRTVSRDVFSFDLNYFNTDFRPIGASVAQFRNPFYNYANETSLVGKQLFNGNIKSMSVTLDQFGLNHFSYRYDQLNRIIEKRSFYNNLGSIQEYNDFNESFTYDANGNILSAVKSASASSPGGINMDILGYQHLPGSNKLDYVTDQVSASAHANNVDGQLSHNYTYDNIGNLVSDVQENIVSISWTVYGKINSILKQNASTGKETNIQYQYDPSGNRVYKNVTQRNIGVTGQDIIDHTYYVRDAQGNVMSTYTKHEEPANTTALKWAEQDLYGSSRLGLMNLNLDVPAQPMVPASGQTLDDDLFTGQYVYELTNHLGNVMATISDKKLFSNIVIPETGVAPFYFPEVLSETDYYAFGQEIKDKSYRLTGTYRYGFNGKENDSEVKGEGNQQDYGMRIYDPRLGRFLSVDPLTPKYPELTPYQFASNRPIDGIDLDGLEFLKAGTASFVLQSKVFRADAFRLDGDKFYRGKTELAIRNESAYTISARHIRQSIEFASKFSPSDFVDGTEPSPEQLNQVDGPPPLQKANFRNLKVEKISDALGEAYDMVQMFKVFKNIYNENFDSKTKDAVETANRTWAALGAANSLVAIAATNPTFPSKLNNPQILTDLTNFITDFTYPNENALSPYSTLIRTWGTLVFNNQDAIQKGTMDFSAERKAVIMKTGPSGVKIRFKGMIGNSNSDVIEAQKLIKNEVPQASTQVR